MELINIIWINLSIIAVGIVGFLCGMIHQRSRDYRYKINKNSMNSITRLVKEKGELKEHIKDLNVDLGELQAKVLMLYKEEKAR